GARPREAAAAPLRLGCTVEGGRCRGDRRGSGRGADPGGRYRGAAARLGCRPRSSGAPVAEQDQQEERIVTGMSGAGRQTVGDALEDLGWYVVDNLPPQMLRPLVDLAQKAGGTLPKIAAVVDVRGGRLFEDAQRAIVDLRERVSLRVVFLDASDAALVRRFEQIRRPHPLQGDGTLLDGIAAERARMEEIRGSSDVVIDTS